jgi:glycosyltransferase involved in cell wall biosynthesis
MSISVVIPVYNCERYLAEAVASIRAQTVAVDEILIIDDGSTDGTAEVARALPAPVRHVRRAHEGGAQALNAGVAEARGEFIAFLDADDLWLPGKLAAQRAVLAADPAIDLVFGLMEQFLSPDLPADRRARLICPEGTQPGRTISALLARRAAFDRVGALATDLRTGWFIDWSMRAEDLGLRHVMLPDLVLRRRIHGDNLGLRDTAGRVDYLEVVRRNLARRRGPK